MVKKVLKKSGQVWIETVIYTLIAFVMIGLLLSYARPKIQELQDQAIIQQSTEMMKQIDSTILNLGAVGNQRILEIGIKAGDLKIDGVNNKIIFELESKGVYSEPGKSINDGNVVILTEKKSAYNLVTLTIDYSAGYDIKFQGQDIVKTISKASNSYKLSIVNNGGDANGKTVLDLSLN
jgi:type II secretory pathway pseudopilin PulG